MRRTTTPGGERPFVLPPASAGTDLERLGAYDVVCFSHLRWDFVFQRPHHLLSRSAALGRVFYVEEPVPDASEPWLDVRPRAEGVIVAVPHLPADLSAPRAAATERGLLEELLAAHDVRAFVAWYYTPMALPASRGLRPAAIVYDCMDELSAFRGAPPELRRLERELFARADLVLTGGRSLYEAKRTAHPNVHPFPSSIDAGHFAVARERRPDPPDQAGIPRPRLGYFGVIDERMDLDLLDAVARARPEWRIVLVGPTAKIDPASLPRRPNLHVLGPKPYADLPDYLAGWDVALMPFACNEATRFISPTKTPEYLAAGRPVVSTPIRDVEDPYGRRGLVRVARGADAFVAAVADALEEGPDERAAWLARVDAFLAGTSWDETWTRMMRLLLEALPTGSTRGPTRRPTARSGRDGGGG